MENCKAGAFSWDRYIPMRVQLYIAFLSEYDYPFVFKRVFQKINDNCRKSQNYSLSICEPM